ncbi:hypothetical protein OFN64_39010, partial [Escherichia coli]|nr:hypothetical protein [Escherichia coli]
GYQARALPVMGLGLNATSALSDGFRKRLCGFLETDHKDKCKRRNVSGSSLTAKHQQGLPTPCQ